jgi:hypothetical protein
MTNLKSCVVLVSLVVSASSFADTSTSTPTSMGSAFDATMFSLDSSGKWAPTPGKPTLPVPGDVLENPGAIIIWINDQRQDDCDPGFYIQPSPPPTVPGLGPWDGDPYFNQVPPPPFTVPGLGPWDGDPYFTQVPKRCNGKWGHFEILNPIDDGWLLPAPVGPNVIVLAPPGTDTSVLAAEIATSLGTTDAASTVKAFDHVSAATPASL